MHVHEWIMTNGKAVTSRSLEEEYGEASAAREEVF